MGTCPKCGHRPIKRRLGIRKCRRCGVLPELAEIAALNAQRTTASQADVVELFPRPAKQRLEVHEHCFIRGPRARYAGTDASHLVHSHEGGDVPHSHPDTGPASYTIEKDEWFRATGLSGGGRKQFTDKPKGEQFALIPRSAEDSSFEVIVCDPPAPPGFTGEGGGHHAAARMVLAFGLRANVRRPSSHDPEPPEAA